MQLKLTLYFPLSGRLSLPSVPPTVTNVVITGTSFYITPASTSPLKDYRECFSLVDKFCFAFFLLEIQCGSDFISLISQAMQIF